MEGTRHVVRAGPTRRRRAALLAGCAALLGGCGGTVATIPQVVSQQPVAAAHLGVRMSGSSDVAVDTSSVAARADEAGLLRVTVPAVSHAPVRSTITMIATLRDAGGAAVGSATGGAVDVAPGAPVTLILTGGLPSAVIASVDLGAAVQPAPTPRT